MTSFWDFLTLRGALTPAGGPKSVWDTFQNISNQKKKKFLSENFLHLKKFWLEKSTRPITPEILISQKISLVSKCRLKRSTKNVPCEFSEKSIFQKLEFRVWTSKIFTKKNCFINPAKPG